MPAAEDQNVQEGESPLDTNLLKEISKKALVDALNSVNGSKTLVLDPSLAGPLGVVTEVSLLKHHGVDKMFWLEAGPLSCNTTNIVYLCRPAVKYVKIIAAHIKYHVKESAKHNYTLLLVPRLSSLVSRLLEEEGVLGDVTLSALNLQFLPIADDVLSLEYDSAFKDIWIDGDESVVYDSVQALITLQKLFGLFPRLLGKGDHAARLINLLTTYLPQSHQSSIPDALSEQSSDFDSLIVIDRRVDMITPLLTQLTYEGLIDEILGIKNSHVELPASLVSPPQPAQATSSTAPPPPPPLATSLRKESKKKYHLSSTDSLFKELRDLNFANVGKRLNGVARRLEDDYKTNLQSRTTAQLREFVGRLGGLQSEHQSLRIHTGISELLVPTTQTEQFNNSLEIQQNLLASYNISEQISSIEEMIARGADIETVVRLLCLASITSGGIKAKALENIKHELLQARTYGYHYLPLLLSLTSPSLAILQPNPSAPPAPSALSKFPFAPLRKSLRLLIDDHPDALDEVENDISFAYSGYAPISVRLVQCVAQRGGVLSNPAEKEKTSEINGSSTDFTSGGTVQAHPIVGWKGFEDVLAIIPGKTVDVVQSGASLGATSRSRRNAMTTVVFFLGGCTYTEISALRWVARQNRGRNFLITTTGIVNGSTIVDGIAVVNKVRVKSGRNYMGFDGDLTSFGPSRFAHEEMAGQWLVPPDVVYVRDASVWPRGKFDGKANPGHPRRMSTWQCTRKMLLGSILMTVNRDMLSLAVSSVGRAAIACGARGSCQPEFTIEAVRVRARIPTVISPNMSSTHVFDSAEPFFQFDPYEGLNSPPMRSHSSALDISVVEDPSTDMENEIPQDKGKQVSKPLPIMISAQEAPEFDDFGTSPAWSTSSSYPDTPDTTTVLPSPSGSSSFPNFTLGSLSPVWQSPSFGFVAVAEEAFLQSLDQNGAGSSVLDGNSKGKGKERDPAGPPLISTCITAGTLEQPSSSSPVAEGETAPSSHAITRISPSRRHSLGHFAPRSRRPSSSLTRLKARFSSPVRYNPRRTLLKKLPTPPPQVAIPQLTQTATIHLHSPAQLSIKLPLDDGALETTEFCMSMHSLFKTKGRSNSAPLPVSALDYIPVVTEDVFAPIACFRNLFDELLPRELKLQILASLVALHESDRTRLTAQVDWTVTRAISSKNRWLGKDRAVRELIKLGRVSKGWQDLIYDGQLWSTLELRSFPTTSRTLLAKVAKTGGRFIHSIDLSGHVNVNSATLLSMTDNMSLPSVITSPPSTHTQLTCINFRGCTALSTRSLHYLLVRGPCLQQVCFRGLQSVTNNTCDIIAMYCPRITKLDLNRCPNMDAVGLKRLIGAVKARGQLLEWRELRISGLKKTDDDMMALLGQVAPFLEVLDLSYAYQLHNSAIDAFVSVFDHNSEDCKSVLLTAREVGRDQAGDSSKYRRRITRLRHISLSSCVMLTDIACSHLAYAVPRLEFLELAGIGEELGEEGLIRLLCTTPLIRRLDLEDATEVTDAVLNAITPEQHDHGTARGIKQLEPGHALEHLIISYAAEVTDDALLALIQSCPRLQVLEADNTRIGPNVLREFCELQRPHSKIVAVDCRSITESSVKDLAPLVRPRRGWRGWDARKLRFLDGRDFGAGPNHRGERDQEKEAVMKAALGQDELDEKRVVLKAFYSWQAVDAVWAARDKRRKTIGRRRANESSGSAETDSEDANAASGARTGGARWWTPGGRRSRSASGSNSPLLMQDPSGGDTIYRCDDNFIKLLETYIY
ncbi:hypothetical protein D9757_002293 [Collybiopsis confluens]|uniref:Uncharacterized protein n=1 Tax=Collybiopsis confluens TaxID=2823264 RepID=A0A8H5HZR6_9AGAR|nr:hypothetical protein D9757_002293 [Collybiopsis confluens]